MSGEGEKLEAFRVDPTLLGGVGGPAPASPPAADAGSGGEKQDAGYPTIEEICSRRKNVEAFGQTLAQTTARLRELVANGTDEQREAAARALRAYELLEAMLEKAVALTIENIKKARAAAGR
ncbi:MAG: hypothetical protein D6776_09390 [Planctomycetota bacterium]|nr:MAG: hypothetical protein D6776_09390 [Planctomycetota bacterium]